MPETRENLQGHVKSYIYYACQTHENYQVLSYSVEFKGVLST